MSGSNCCFLTSCSFLRRQLKLSGISISLRMSEAEVDLKKKKKNFSSFFYDPTDIGNVVSDSYAFSNSSLYIWKFFVHILLKPSLKDFEHYLASKWNEVQFYGSLNISWYYLSELRMRTDVFHKKLINPRRGWSGRKYVKVNRDHHKDQNNFLNECIIRILQIL